MRLVVAHKAIDKGVARHHLHFRIERGANRKAALVELLFAIAVEQLAAHFLGEEAGGIGIRRKHARCDAKRLGLRLGAIGVGET